MASNNEAQVITLLVQIAAQEAPAIIEAIQTQGGSVGTVGPLVSADRATIDADAKQLQDEQQPPAGS